MSVTWQLDKRNTKLEFSVKHMVIATVRGTFDEFEADIDMPSDDPTEGKVTARISTASVNTKDKSRDEYLTAPDFFNPGQYPHIVFESTGVRLAGKKISVTGKMRIRDKERSLILEGSVKGPESSFGKKRLKFDLSADLDRESFGLSFNQAVETVSVVVGKKVSLKLHIELESA